MKESALLLLHWILLAVTATALQPPKAENINADYAVFPPKKGDYKCIIIDVHDGDSVTVGLILPLKIRLAGCNAIELKDPGGPEAQKALCKLLPQTVPVTAVRIFKPDKFNNRADGDFQTDKGFWVSKVMIERGHAFPWDGRGERPVKKEDK